MSDRPKFAMGPAHPDSLQQLGAALGLVLGGKMAELYSTPVAWTVGVVFLLIAVILMVILAQRLARETNTMR